MPATIRVSAVYTMTDHVSGKLARMTTRVKALEERLDRSVGTFHKLEKNMKALDDPLKKLNKNFKEMNSTIGSAKSTSGLQYRVSELSSKLNKISKDHKITLSSTGVKSVENDLNRVHDRLSGLTREKHTIKIDVDRKSIDALREQASVLKEVRGEIDGLMSSFDSLTRGESSLHKSFAKKTNAVREQRIAMRKADAQMHTSRRNMDHYARSVREGGRDLESFSEWMAQAGREAYSAGTMFRAGASMAMGFLKAIPFIAAGANVASVALGGLISILHGVVGPVLAVGSNIKDMVALLGLIPGAASAAGVSFVSFAGAVKAYLGDALKSGVKLSEIKRQLESATGDKRKQLLDQEKKMLEGMNAQQKKLANSIADLGSKYRKVFTSNEGLQKKFFGTANAALSTLSKLLDKYKIDLQSTADSVRLIADRFIQVVGTNKDLASALSAAFRIARSLAGNIQRSLNPLITFFGRVVQASEGPITRIGDAFERWAIELGAVSESKINSTLTRALDISGLWWDILKNIGGAFANIFAAGKSESDGFLVTLERVTKQFKEWTGGRGMPLIRREWKQGMRVGKALGRILVTLTKGFMGIGGDKKSTDSVVGFLDAFNNGLKKLFPFLTKMVSTLGPAMTNFFRSMGGAGALLDGVNQVLVPMLGVLASLNRIFSLMPDKMKNVIGVMIGLKIASHAAGGVFGTFLGIMFNGRSTVDRMAEALKNVADNAKKVGTFVSGGGPLGAMPTPVTGSKDYGAGQPFIVDSEGVAQRGGSRRRQIQQRLANGKQRFINAGRSAKGGASRMFTATAAAVTTLPGAGSVDKMMKSRGGRAIGGVSRGAGRVVGGVANAGILQPILKPLQAIGNVAGKAGRGLGFIARYLLGLEQVGSKFGRFTIIGTIIFAVIDGLIALATNFNGIRDEMAQFTSDVVGRFKEAFSKLSEALGLGALGSEEFKKKMANLSLFLKSMGWAAVKVFKVIASFVVEVTLYIIDTVTAVVNVVKGLAIGLWKIIVGIIDLFRPGHFIEGLKLIWAGVKKLFTSVFEFLWAMFKNGVVRFGEFLMDSFGGFGTKITNIFIDLINFIGDKVNAILPHAVPHVDRKIDRGTVNDMVERKAAFVQDMKTGVTSQKDTQKALKSLTDQLKKSNPGVNEGDLMRMYNASYDKYIKQHPEAIAPRANANTGQPAVNGVASAQPTGTGVGKGKNAKGKGAQPSSASAGLADQAVTGRTSSGLTVGFDKGSLSTFEANVTSIRHGLDRLKVGPRFISKPLNTAMTNAIGTIDTLGKSMVSSMDTLGANLSGSVKKWAGEVKKALNNMSPGITVDDVKAALGGGSGSTPTKKAGGGFIVPGDSRRPDSVHALLKPGEVVLNEGQQRKLGRGLISKSLSGPGTAANGAFGFNMSGASPSMLKFAAGGTVPELTPYMNEAVKLGGTITSTTGGRHAKNSYHYKGQAFDTDGGPAVNTKIFNTFKGDAALGKLVELFYDPSGGYKNGKSVGAIGGHSDHVHAAVALGAIAGALGTAVKLPASPSLGTSRFGRIAGNSAGVMGAALQKAVDNSSVNFGDLTEGSGAAGSNKQIGRQMAASLYGWTGNEWANLHELWMRESGWNNTAMNPTSGAYGIPQALPASKLPFAGQAAGGSSASAQIGWGLNYIKNRYGSPSKAIEWHNAHNWYGMGGSGIADKPQLIGVGDKREHVQITPASTQANPSGITPTRSGSGGSSNVTNNFYIGTLSGDRKHLKQLADMVGETIADALEGASRSRVKGSRDVMSGNG